MEKELNFMGRDGERWLDLDRDPGGDLSLVLSGWIEDGIRVSQIGTIALSLDEAKRLGTALIEQAAVAHQAR